MYCNLVICSLIYYLKNIILGTIDFGENFHTITYLFFVPKSLKWFWIVVLFLVWRSDFRTISLLKMVFGYCKIVEINNYD